MQQSTSFEGFDGVEAGSPSSASAPVPREQDGAGGIYAIAVAFAVTNIGLSVALALGGMIGGLAGAVFPRFGHRSLFYVWCLALGI